MNPKCEEYKSHISEHSYTNSKINEGHFQSDNVQQEQAVVAPRSQTTTQVQEASQLSTADQN